MRKVSLICGKICSGKSTLAKELREKNGGVILSVDELMQKLFPAGAGDKHDELSGKVKAYLYGKADELLMAGIDVILDWGFWSRRERSYVTEHFKERGAEVCWHFTNIDDETHLKFINGRNKKILAGESTDYFVDEGLFAKAQFLFHEPTEEEKAKLTK